MIAICDVTGTDSWRLHYPDIIAHFCGCVLLSWFIIESWTYLSFWYLFVFFRYVQSAVDSFGCWRYSSANDRRRFAAFCPLYLS